MAEESEAETQQQQFQGAKPLLLSAAAALRRERFRSSLGKRCRAATPRVEGASRSDESRNDRTSFEDVDDVADDLETLVAELRAESASSGNSPRLVEIADTISEYADQAAGAFHAAVSGADTDGAGSERRVTDELMDRISEITRQGKEAQNEKENAGADAQRGSKTTSRS